MKHPYEGVEFTGSSAMSIQRCTEKDLMHRTYCFRLVGYFSHFDVLCSLHMTQLANILPSDGEK